MKAFASLFVGLVFCLVENLANGLAGIPSAQAEEPSSKYHPNIEVAVPPDADNLAVWSAVSKGLIQAAISGALTPKSGTDHSRLIFGICVNQETPEDRMQTPCVNLPIQYRSKQALPPHLAGKSGAVYTQADGRFFIYTDPNLLYSVSLNSSKWDVMNISPSDGLKGGDGVAVIVKLNRKKNSKP